MPPVQQERPAQPRALGASGLTLGPQRHRESGSSGAAKKNYTVRAQEAPMPCRGTSSLLSRAPSPWQHVSFDFQGLRLRSDPDRV